MSNPTRNIVFLLGWLIIAHTTDLDAQDEVGIVAGAAFNNHLAAFSKLGSYPSCCPEFTGGSGTGFYLGGWYGLALNERFRFLGRITFSTENGGMTDEERSFVADLRDTAKVVDAMFTHQLDATLSSIGIEPLFAFRAVGGLDLLLGARLAMTLTTSFHQTETLTQPEDFGAYLGDDRVWVDTQADIPQALGLRATLVGGIRYVLPMGKGRSTFLAPEITYHLPLTNVASGVNWSVAQFRLGIAIGWELWRDQNVDSTPVSTATFIPSPPPVIVIAAPILSIQVSGIRPDGSIMSDPVVHVEETQVTTLHPLIGHIYFDEGASDIPQRYHDGIIRALADTIALTPLEATQGELAIIAQRMNALPKSRLKITGHTSGTASDNGLDLARMRAERVREKLIELGVPIGRMDVYARALPVQHARATEPEMMSLAAEENRRVEIVASDPSLLGPVSLGSIDVSIDPGSLQLTSAIDAQGGLRQARLTLRQGSRTLLDVDQRDQSSRLNTIELATKEPRTFTANPFIAEVSATDSLGQISTARDTIELAQLTITKKRIEQLGDTQIERFGLILFDFNDVAIKGDNAKLIEYIRSRIKPGTKVRVIGATDLMGSAVYNLDLSVRRAREVARLLNVPDSMIQGIGEDRPLFPNVLPEGRAYNRTVVIELVTTIR